MSSAPMAFMDSGIGGLTVLKTALKELPQENMIYLGDEAHLPYGKKTAAQVISYADEIGNYFEKQNAKIMIVACNTASATALSSLQKELKIPVIGVINPGSKAAAKATKNKHVGVIATSGTVASHAYRDAIKKIDNDINVSEVACQDFVTLVEKGDYTSDFAKKTVAKGLETLKNSDIDTLVLGCTHFPIIANLIQEEIGNDVKLIDPGNATVKKASQIMADKDLFASSQDPKDEFFTTKDVQHFNDVASKWLNQNISANLVTPSELENYEK